MLDLILLNQLKLHQLQVTVRETYVVVVDGGGQSSISVRPCPMSTLELLEASNMGQ